MTAYAAAGAAVLVLLPVIAFRGRTLARYFGAAAGVALLGVLARQQLGAFDAGLALAALGVTLLALFALFLAAAPAAEVRWSADRAAVMALLVYALLVPAMLRYPIDGDEPFYLLVTESVVHDHDLDLRNQYRDIAGSATRRPDLKPQYGDPTGPHGEQYSRTELLLSLLLVPGYVAGGLAGAVATLALFGALLVRSTVRLLEDEGIEDGVVRAVFPFFAFAPPVLFYSVRLWPEVPAALAFVEGLRGVRQRRPQRWIPALFALTLLKLRFILIAAPLLLRAGLRRRKYAAIAAAAVAVPLLVAWIVSGSAANVHSWRELLPYAPRLYLAGAFGLLLDGAAGMLFQAPFYLLGIFAIIRWRDMPEGFRLGIWSAVLYFVYLVPRSEWHGGWSPPLRYIVVLMPLLALGAAAIWRRIDAAVVALIAVWTIGQTVHGIAFPWRLFHIANGENTAGERLSMLFHSDFSRLFPSFIRMNHAAVVASVVLVIALALSWGAGLLPARRPAPGDAPTADLRPRRASLGVLSSALIAALLAWAYAAGQQPGPVVQFEDTHVIHKGGELFPPIYTPMRFLYRGGWMLHAGQSLSTLARGGPADLYYSANEPAVIDVAGRRYAVPGGPGDRMLRVEIPRGGRVEVRCVAGWVNLDRIESRS